MTAGIPPYALDAGAAHAEDEGAVGVGVGVGVGGAGAGESPPSFGGPNRYKQLRRGYVKRCNPSICSSDQTKHPVVSRRTLGPQADGERVFGPIAGSIAVDERVIVHC